MYACVCLCVRASFFLYVSLSSFLSLALSPFLSLSIFRMVLADPPSPIPDKNAPPKSGTSSSHQAPVPHRGTGYVNCQRRVSQSHCVTRSTRDHAEVSCALICRSIYFSSNFFILSLIMHTLLFFLLIVPWICSRDGHYLTAGPITKLIVCGEGECEGHALLDMTSRGVCGPPRTSEHVGKGDCVKGCHRPPVMDSS